MKSIDPNVGTMVGSGGEKDAVPETPFSESANHFKAALQEVASMGEARVIIVGSGFAGVTLAEDLNRRAAPDIEVVVIGSENHMVFTPMLAEVAGRSLSGLDVVVPGRQIARRATWLTATVTSVDLNENEVDYTRPDGRTATLSYSHLVLACGSDINLDIVPGMAAHAYALRTVSDGMILATKLSAALSRQPSNPMRLSDNDC